MFKFSAIMFKFSVIILNLNQYYELSKFNILNLLKYFNYNKISVKLYFYVSII